ncbi:hypothetical protein C6P46_002957 [Rhodotorula mucilaginosa]|uniref:Uncharacterized protein n=1 Tax=Rhodotorula mucilaginosa TaxID=5537 RepID=A0A9P6W400_RHOMI|nr:hypothetical protein C6P46_002957 [Rhodotorula mucilaginosa]
MPPGLSPEDQAARVTANARGIFFFEIFHGQEGESDVRDRFYTFLQEIDDFLQVLTLGISADKPEDESITTACYRKLPAAHIGLLEEGNATAEGLHTEMEIFLYQKDLDIHADFVSTKFAGPACIRAADQSRHHVLRPFWPMALWTKRWCDEEFHPDGAWHVWLKDIHRNLITFQSPIGNLYRVRLQQYDLVAHQTAPQLGQPAKWLVKFIRCWQTDPADPNSPFTYADGASFCLTLEYHLEPPAPFHPVART